jgi:hypothetical protein
VSAVAWCLSRQTPAGASLPARFPLSVVPPCLPIAHPRCRHGPSRAPTSTVRWTTYGPRMDDRAGCVDCMWIWGHGCVRAPHQRVLSLRLRAVVRGAQSYDDRTRRTRPMEPAPNAVPGTTWRPVVRSLASSRQPLFDSGRPELPPTPARISPPRRGRPAAARGGWYGVRRVLIGSPIEITRVPALTKPKGLAVPLDNISPRPTPPGRSCVSCWWPARLPWR